jgi:ubiquinone/menaquinone biosynthesis C-methylase UbiE
MPTELRNPAGPQVEAMYDADPAREWTRADRHRTEHGVTMCALCQYLPPPPASILDCGGGPGRYAVELARLGYRVTLFDPSSANLSMALLKAGEAGVTLDYAHGTATDLSTYAEGQFGAVLLMGPLYHLLEEDSRDRAVSEAARVVKPGGRVFASFITRYAPVRYAVAQNIAWFVEKPDALRQILRTGVEPLDSAPPSRFVAHYAHPRQVAPMLGAAGLEMDALLAVDALVSQIEAQVNRLQGDAWERWVDLCYTAAADPALLGAAEHLLAIATRPTWRSVVRQIARQLDRGQVPFRIVGGAAAALQGADIPVQDVDVETSARGARTFQEKYGTRTELPVAWRESDRYRSHFGRFRFGEVIVEVMGDLERLEAGRWVPSQASPPCLIDVDGVLVPVSRIEEEALAYIRRGRLDRAAACLAHADHERLLRLIRREEPTDVL